MPIVKLQRQAFQRALDRVQLTPQEIDRVNELIGSGARTVNVRVEVDELPPNYLAGLLDEAGLNVNQRAMVSMRVHGMRGDRSEFEKVYNTSVSSRVEFASMFCALGIQSPNCEYFINGRWYPIALAPECQEDEMRLHRSVYLKGSLSIGDMHQQIIFSVPSHLFRNDDGETVEKTVRQVLQDIGLRTLRMSASDHNLKLLKSERLSRETGKLVWISGPVLIGSNYAWWGQLQSRSLGSKDAPRKAVIEHELETCEGHRNYYGTDNDETSSRLPFVRLFSLDSKRYVYADVDDLDEYQYDEGAIDRLHLPGEMLKILTTVFTAPTEAVFGDLIAGKHGGIVILASGKPGVGKTLTAEVYSEITGRPLYVLELGELGTTAEAVEESLNRMFNRVARWDAVLQFDECEIFLARRGDDLERSAIVGIFLRLLDYYRGILFLTTNRPEVLDQAVISRVTLRLQYPDLSPETRLAVWQTMLSVAELPTPIGALEELAKVTLNGREIRNMVRLAKLVYPGEPLTVENLVALIDTASPRET